MIIRFLFIFLFNARNLLIALIQIYLIYIFIMSLTVVVVIIRKTIISFRLPRSNERDRVLYLYSFNIIQYHYGSHRYNAVCMCVSVYSLPIIALNVYLHVQSEPIASTL